MRAKTFLAHELSNMKLSGQNALLVCWSYVKDLVEVG